MEQVGPADSLLAIDVGNTRAGIGIWDSDGLHDCRRSMLSEPDDWREMLEKGVEGLHGDRRAIVMGSVNPTAAMRIQEAVEDICHLPVLRVRDDLPLPLPMDIEHADQVGVDRICSAAAAHERTGGACAVASFGTALTIDCVSAEGHFLGGTILPGLDMACAALHDNTAQLPEVTVTGVPEKPFGRNTEEAIAGGVVFGMVGALREIVERYATELREWPRLVVTGGNAPLVAELADFIDAIVPDLCLMGIALTYRRAAGEA